MSAIPVKKTFTESEYLLVSQEKAMIEKYSKRGESWVLMETEGLNGVVHLESIDCVLAMNEVYDRVFDSFGKE